MALSGRKRSSSSARPHDSASRPIPSASSLPCPPNLCKGDDRLDEHFLHPALLRILNDPRGFATVPTSKNAVEIRAVAKLEDFSPTASAGSSVGAGDCISPEDEKKKGAYNVLVDWIDGIRDACRLTSLVVLLRGWNAILLSEEPREKRRHTGIVG